MHFGTIVPDVFGEKNLSNASPLPTGGICAIFLRFCGDFFGQVRLWAAMRTQTVAKTVVGALQYA